MYYLSNELNRWLLWSIPNRNASVHGPRDYRSRTSRLWKASRYLVPGVHNHRNGHRQNTVPRAGKSSGSHVQGKQKSVGAYFFFFCIDCVWAKIRTLFLLLKWFITKTQIIITSTTKWNQFFQSAHILSYDHMFDTKLKCGQYSSWFFYESCFFILLYWNFKTSHLYLSTIILAVITKWLKYNSANMKSVFFQKIKSQ